MEGDPQNKIESEIAELTKQIEEKRRILESNKGIIEEKEIVRQAIGEKIAESTSAPRSSSVKPITLSGTSSYLDSVDKETEEKVNSLLQIFTKKGLKAAIKELEGADFFVVDAFHDALTDKMYEQLKEKGLVA